MSRHVGVSHLLVSSCLVTPQLFSARWIERRRQTNWQNTGTGHHTKETWCCAVLAMLRDIGNFWRHTKAVAKLRKVYSRDVPQFPTNSVSNSERSISPSVRTVLKVCRWAQRQWSLMKPSQQQLQRSLQVTADQMTDVSVVMMPQTRSYGGLCGL